jgi:RNA polymerase sigma factor (sigma-70 family)
MDVQGLPARTARTVAGGEEVPLLSVGRAGLARERVGQALGQWQSAELRLARSFAECKGLSHEQLEDLYQDTALVMLSRSFHNEEHLRNALRWGLKRRALHLHRDERRRGEILSQRAPELQLTAEGREQEHTPELAAVLAQDRLFVSEFLSELSELERRVFWLVSEGMRYRAIAPVLEIEVNAARKAFRGCERKRERFQLLHDTGRLCGFRSHTIQALLSGEGASERLARAAFAHVEHCAQCRTEHKTNARRLRRSFQEQAAALVPIPALAAHMGWLSRLDLRARTLHQRLLPYGSPPGTGAIRERAIAVVAGGGVAAKLAAGAATVVVIAGGAIGATHELAVPRSSHRGVGRKASRRHAPSGAVILPATATDATVAKASRRSMVQASARRSPLSANRGVARKETGGFGFLGVPSTGQASSSQAHAASVRPPEQQSPAPEVGSRSNKSPVLRQTGGGAFSP